MSPLIMILPVNLRNLVFSYIKIGNFQAWFVGSIFQLKQIVLRICVRRKGRKYLLKNTLKMVDCYLSQKRSLSGIIVIV